jgi:DNA-nicking Smr family endonuclease
LAVGTYFAFNFLKFFWGGQAFLAGNKALAKELGAKGRAAAESMRAAHDTASQQIYRSRNQGRAGAEDMIDLHGLHAREGVRFLQ